VHPLGVAIAMSRASHRNERTRRQHPVVLRETLALRRPNGANVVVRPLVLHRLTAEWVGLGNPKHRAYLPLTHRFDLVVRRDALENSLTEGDTPSDEEWEQYRALYHPVQRAGRLTIGEPDREDPNELWLAHLDIAELPSRHVDQLGGWYQVCNAASATLRAALPLILEVQEDSSSKAPGALIDGALIWPKLLGVHPHVRGQDLGVQLLAHGLWALRRSTSDLAVLEAAAVRSHFDWQKPEQTRESLRALCRYYARLGFRRQYPRLPYSNEHSNLMWLPIGCTGVRAFLPDGTPL
jgi:GNAT superfamily N-acetyltransferase